MRYFSITFQQCWMPKVVVQISFNLSIEQLFKRTYFLCFFWSLFPWETSPESPFGDYDMRIKNRSKKWLSCSLQFECFNVFILRLRVSCSTDWASRAPMMLYVKRDDKHVMLSRIQETESYLECFCVLFFYYGIPDSFKIWNNEKIANKSQVDWALIVSYCE